MKVLNVYDSYLKISMQKFQVILDEYNIMCENELMRYNRELKMHQDDSTQFFRIIYSFHDELYIYHRM